MNGIPSAYEAPSIYEALITRKPFISWSFCLLRTCRVGADLPFLSLNLCFVLILYNQPSGRFSLLGLKQIGNRVTGTHSLWAGRGWGWLCLPVGKGPSFCQSVFCPRYWGQAAATHWHDKVHPKVYERQAARGPADFKSHSCGEAKTGAT